MRRNNRITAYPAAFRKRSAIPSSSWPQGIVPQHGLKGVGGNFRRSTSRPVCAGASQPECDLQRAHARPRPRPRESWHRYSCARGEASYSLPIRERPRRRFHQVASRRSRVRDLQFHIRSGELRAGLDAQGSTPETRHDPQGSILLRPAFRRGSGPGGFPRPAQAAEDQPAFPLGS